MSTIKDDIFAYLSSQGLQPQAEDFGIYFKYQMLNFFILWNEGDELFLKICLPGIFDVDENNRAEVLEATNAVTRDMKVAKCFVPEDDVWITTEQLLDTTPDYGDIIPRSLRILIQARKEFYDNIQA